MKINGVTYGECDVCKDIVPLKTLRSKSATTYCQVCYQNCISGEFRPVDDKCHRCGLTFPISALNYDGYPLCKECFEASECEQAERDWSTDRDQQDCPDCPTCIADGIGAARPL